MNYKQLGRSGLLVSDLALGTMTFGNTTDGGARGTDQAESTRLVHRFLDAGGNHIDTADVYVGGRSEEIVGQAIADRRHDVVVATKVRMPMGANPNQQGLSRYHIMQAVENSLHRLQTDYIDLYYMHVWDPITPIEESLRAFEDLVTAGKVRYIGVSNFKAWQVMKSLAASDSNGWQRFVAAQYQYSLVKRDIEYEFDDLCATEGLGVVPWAALGSGFLTGKYERDKRPTSVDEGRIGATEDDWEETWERRSTVRNWRTIDAVGAIARERGATHGQIALAWLRAQPIVSSVIMGVRTMAQLEDNLGSAEITLTSAELATLAEASNPDELYPYRMHDLYSQRDANPSYMPTK